MEPSLPTIHTSPTIHNDTAFPDFTHAEAKAAKQGVVVPTRTLERARSYLDDPKNSVLLAQSLLINGDRKWGVINKSLSQLDFAVEYFGPNQAYARCKSYFIRGTFKICSLHVHLYKRNAFAKLKIPVYTPSSPDPQQDTNKAAAISLVNAFYLSKRKDIKFTELMPEDQLIEELRMTARLKDVPEVLQPERVEKYTKRYGNSTFTVYSVYTLLQDGDGDNLPDQYKDKFARAFLIAIARINNLGFVLNDVNLGNILYSEEGGKLTIKVIDLQFASRVDSTTYYFSGTFSMVPPELFYNLHAYPKEVEKQRCTLAKEAWSMGVSLFELYDNVFKMMNLEKSERERYLSRLPKIAAFQKNKPAKMPSDIYNVAKGLLTVKIESRLTCSQAEKLIKAS